MSNPDDVLSSGGLPGLQPISASVTTPSISTHVAPRQNPNSHVTTTAPAPVMAPGNTAAATAKGPSFSKLHIALGSNSLIKSAITTIPKLTGNENYINWSDQVIAAFRYCGIEKILTGEWKKPEIITGDTDTEKEANEWGSLDAWIALHLNLSDGVRSQVRHLATSFAKWEELQRLFKPVSLTSITLHLTSIVNICYDESTKFEDFVATKCEHNWMFSELGGMSLLDSYIAIFIHSGLPDHLKQTITHIPDNTITTDQIINIICSRQQESLIQMMQSSPSSESALLGRQGKNAKKRDFQPCKIPGCPRPDTHPTKNCWVPGGLKHDPNRQRKSNLRGKERANKVDDDEDDEDNGNSSMNIHINRSFVVKKSDSSLLYSARTPIIIDSGTMSHILTK